MKAPRVPSEKFKYSARNRLFSVDRGDVGRLDAPLGLRGEPGARGFVMVSEKSGSEILFVLAGCKRGRYNELLWETYLGCDLRGEVLPGRLSGLELRIYEG